MWFCLVKARPRQALVFTATARACLLGLGMVAAPGNGEVQSEVGQKWAGDVLVVLTAFHLGRPQRGAEDHVGVEGVPPLLMMAAAASTLRRAGSAQSRCPGSRSPQAVRRWGWCRCLQHVAVGFGGAMLSLMRCGRYHLPRRPVPTRWTTPVPTRPTRPWGLLEVCDIPAPGASTVASWYSNTNEGHGRLTPARGWAVWGFRYPRGSCRFRSRSRRRRRRRTRSLRRVVLFWSQRPWHPVWCARRKAQRRICG